MNIWLQEKWTNPAIRVAVKYVLLCTGLIFFPVLFIAWWVCNRKTIPLWLGTVVTVAPIAIALPTYRFYDQIAHTNWYSPLESMFSLMGSFLAISFSVIRLVTVSDRTKRFYNLGVIGLFLCLSFLLLSPTFFFHMFILAFPAKIPLFQLYLAESGTLLWILLLVFLHRRYVSDAMFDNFNHDYKALMLQKKQRRAMASHVSPKTVVTSIVLALLVGSLVGWCVFLETSGLVYKAESRFAPGVRLSDYRGIVYDPASRDSFGVKKELRKVADKYGLKVLDTESALVFGNSGEGRVLRASWRIVGRTPRELNGSIHSFSQEVQIVLTDFSSGEILYTGLGDVLALTCSGDVRLAMHEALHGLLSARSKR